ncbi:PIG-L family deacetylase [Microbacteriaceae bacterium VKM Ac-2855]|nr:PIG-L family deacetylase [Microbacteriaceae bacterium VKM Ac-2855]
MVTFDGRAAGTPVDVWDADERMRELPTLALPPVDRVLIVAAHPDDESLGAGGLIAECGLRGIPVDVLILTDGGGSHPESPTVSAPALILRRRAETLAALAALEPRTSVEFLDLPDGGTREHRDRVRAAVAAAAAGAPGSVLLISTWVGDGHRDHRIVGEVVAEVAAELDHPALAYPIWLWHWGTPADSRVPWPDMVALPLSDRSIVRKRRAIAAHASQIAPLSPEPGDETVLHPLFVRNFDRDAEPFIRVSPGALARRPALEHDYFEALYERHEDPWGYTGRWYEHRKRALTLAALPDRGYSSALEIGCSIGILAEELAARCDRLLAIDSAAEAVRRSRERLAEHSGVRVQQCDVTEGLPGGPFDLIVLSEVGYYLDADALGVLLRRIDAVLTDDGVLLVVHWRHPIAGAPLTGDEVHRAVARLRLPRLARIEEEDLLLEVYSRDPRSVARRTGLL